MKSNDLKKLNGMELYIELWIVACYFEWKHFRKIEELNLRYPKCGFTAAEDLTTDLADRDGYVHRKRAQLN